MIIKKVLCRLFSVAGEDVWRCSVNATWEQAGSGRHTKQTGDHKGGAEAGRGEVYLNIQTTFFRDFPHYIFLDEIHFWFLQQHQALFYECSAKTAHNMEELMTHLAR